MREKLRKSLRSAESAREFNGTVTMIDKNDNGKFDDSWLMLEEETDEGSQSSFLACKKISIGANKTSFKGEGCGKVSCSCGNKGCSNTKTECATAQFLDSSRYGFKPMKLKSEDDLSEFERKSILNANSKKLHPRSKI